MYKKWQCRSKWYKKEKKSKSSHLKAWISNCLVNLTANEMIIQTVDDSLIDRPTNCFNIGTRGLQSHDLILRQEIVVKFNIFMHFLYLFALGFIKYCSERKDLCKQLSPLCILYYPSMLFFLWIRIYLSTNTNIYSSSNFHQILPHQKELYGCTWSQQKNKNKETDDHTY